MKTRLKLLSTSLFLTTCFLLTPSIASAAEGSLTTAPLSPGGSAVIGAQALTLGNTNNGGLFYLAPEGTLTLNIQNGQEPGIGAVIPPIVTVTPSEGLSLTQGTDNGSIWSAYDNLLKIYVSMCTFKYQAPSVKSTTPNIIHVVLRDGTDLYFTIMVE